MSPAVLLRKLEEAIRAEYQTADLDVLHSMHVHFDLDYIDAARRVLHMLRSGETSQADLEAKEFAISFLGGYSEFPIPVGIRIQALYDISRRAVDAALAEGLPSEVPLDLDSLI